MVANGELFAEDKRKVVLHMLPEMADMHIVVKQVLSPLPQPRPKMSESMSAFQFFRQLAKPRTNT